MQLALALVVGLLLLANLFTLTLVALTPATRAARAPVLLTVFIITLVVSVPSILLLPRWLLRPYRQLVDEAERAPVGPSARERTRDETEFVLETFQEVVAQLHAKQRELERLSAKSAERAATAEQFSERVVASLPSGLVAFNSEGRATVVNAPARSILGLDDAAGTDGGEDFRALLARAPELVEMVEHCLSAGELFRREKVTTTLAGGRARRLGVTVAPIDPLPRGGARGVLCMLTDITEVAQLREAVARKRNLESLGEMSAGLAHEFKNALATLHGYAQLLQKLDGEGRAAATAALLQEVRGLSEMVTSFLNFARPKPPDFDDVSLAALIENCAEDLRTFFGERRVSLAIAGEFACVRADERMLRQALLNLLRNAAEAIPEESLDRRVAVNGAVESDDSGRAWAGIEIEDTGTGIPEEDRQRIFIPFFTTKSKGHGVGLALAHRVATDHGGTLAASNSPAGGAVFTLRLPLPV
ncbi:MAG: two-component system, NtrC family, sensor histidine kinase HydH [Acidobacteriota bacterium]|nr:two-component system, NtrC family, sensor histidine kinase HydH [Acidobacteriota bacterium]